MNFSPLLSKEQHDKSWQMQLDTVLRDVKKLCDAVTALQEKNLELEKRLAILEEKAK